MGGVQLPVAAADVVADPERRQHGVALARARGRDVLDLLLPLHPPVARDDHDVVFFDDEVVGREFLLVELAGDLRAARIAVLLLHLLDLAADDLPQVVFALEQLTDLLRALALLGEFLLDHEDLEARQTVDLEFEDRVGLLGIELEPLHDLLGGVGLAFRLAHDLQDLVERVEDRLEAFEDVDALLQRLEDRLADGGGAVFRVGTLDHDPGRVGGARLAQRLLVVVGNGGEERGDFDRAGYFPGIAVRPEPPRILLVAPALQFHPTTETILRFLASDVQVECLGLGLNWRREVKVAFRSCR